MHSDYNDLPDIAVGLLSFNRAGDVMRSLRVILQSDYPADKLHAVVIDNGSSDRTAEQVYRAFGDRVEVVQLPENIGAVARNRLIMDRPEKYLFVFDEDCQPEHERTLRDAVRFMESHPYFGALCFRTINMYSLLTEYGDLRTVSRRRLEGGRINEGVYVVGNGMGFRREAIQRTRGYDETLFWGSEEYNLAMELMYEDVPIAYLPEIALMHRRTPRAYSSAREAELSTRNNILVVAHYYPIPLAIVATVMVIARRLAASLLRGRYEIARATIDGIFGAVRRMRQHKVKRHPVSVGALAANNRWFWFIHFRLRDARSIQTENL